MIEETADFVQRYGPWALVVGASEGVGEAPARVIGLDEVPDALELTRRSEGPPRIIVHPHG